MILTKKQILLESEKGSITITPFNSSQLNPNSYNYRIGNKIKVFNLETNAFYETVIPNSGYILEPGQMYLSNTLEKIGSSVYAMSLIGRSSMGRLGLYLQCSANLGHTGSEHQWTLELVAAKRIKIYPFMIIGQVSFWVNQSAPDLYNGYYGNFNEPTESNVSSPIE